MRLQDRPRFRAGCAIRFADFFAAGAGGQGDRPGRALPGELPHPRPAGGGEHRRRRRQCRDHGAGLRIGRPSARRLDRPGPRMLRRPRRRRGTPLGERDAHREGAAESWRTAFIRMPYARERMIRRSIIADTFETAITWERFRGLPRPGQGRCRNRDPRGHRPAGPGNLPLYPRLLRDGPAPYFSFHARGRHGELEAQWRTIKSAAGDALIEAGGTITHHHAVGRDHRPWYDRQRPACSPPRCGRPKVHSIRRACSIPAC